jgi:hypothetical protein
MPFKSQAQRRKFWSMVSRGEISRPVAEEWEAATPENKDLPERIGKEKKAMMDAFFDELQKIAEQSFLTGMPSGGDASAPPGRRRGMRLDEFPTIPTSYSNNDAPLRRSSGCQKQAEADTDQPLLTGLPSGNTDEAPQPGPAVGRALQGQTQMPTTYPHKGFTKDKEAVT